MKMLVTGATGFIGSHLTERLVKDGHDVSALVRRRGPGEQRAETMEILRRLKVRIFYGDLQDKDSLLRSVSGKGVVFHLAAIARPMAIPRDAYFRTNEEGTRNVLEACRKRGVKRVIHMSSISAVGPTRDGKPVSETSKASPIDIYGESKLAAEKVVSEYVNKHGMHIVMLRPPMVFGPRDLEMLRLFRSVKRGFFPVRAGKDSRTEFLYVGNLVEACLLALKRGKKGETYHISNERSYSMDTIAGAIAKAEGVKMLPIKVPGWCISCAGWLMELLGYVFRFRPPFKHDTVEWMTKKFWYSDISKAERELGYKAGIGLEEGVKRTVEYYTERGMI